MVLKFFFRNDINILKLPLLGHHVIETVLEYGRATEANVFNAKSFALLNNNNNNNNNINYNLQYTLYHIKFRRNYGPNVPSQ